MALTASANAQKFICNTGYTLEDCRTQSSMLKTALSKYGADQLPWTWVLIKTHDWKPFLVAIHSDPDSPAVTFLDLHETLLEETLFSPSADRSAELLQHFGIPLDQLAAHTISHELGHIECREANEIKVEKFAKQLREGKHPSCS